MDGEEVTPKKLNLSSPFQQQDPIKDFTISLSINFKFKGMGFSGDVEEFLEEDLIRSPNGEFSDMQPNSLAELEFDKSSNFFPFENFP